MFSSDGMVYCAKYSSYVRYLDAVRPIFDESEKIYKCPLEEMILCPNLDQQTLNNPELSENTFCVMDHADCPIT